MMIIRTKMLKSIMYLCCMLFCTHRVIDSAWWPFSEKKQEWKPWHKQKEYVKPYKRKKPIKQIKRGKQKPRITSEQRRRFKIVGLVQTYNDATIVEQCLRTLSMYTDSIVVLDDASTDNTVEIVKSFTHVFNIENIICNQVSALEVGKDVHNRSLLLAVGREVGGSHFIQIYPHEMLSKNCWDSHWLRNRILSLDKGEILRLPTHYIWGNLDSYRSDGSWNPNKSLSEVAMRDPGNIPINNSRNDISKDGLRGVKRFPHTKNTRYIDIKRADGNYRLLNFAYVDKKNIYTNRVWDVCLKRVMTNNFGYNKKGETRLNSAVETIQEFENNITLKRATKTWYDYPFFDSECYFNNTASRIKQINGWINWFGKDICKDFDLEFLGHSDINIV